jgi:hypothetical protein
MESRAIHASSGQTSPIRELVKNAVKTAIDSFGRSEKSSAWEKGGDPCSLGDGKSQNERDENNLSQER